MRLHRVEIAQFRKLTGPVVLDGLGDGGLVVVSGDNEEGKSTVLAALKAAFFEHHAVGGAVREAMAPHRGGVPEVAVEFECDGQRFSLRKAFRRAGVVLEAAAGPRLQDDAAERRLQELLRFERRQARKPLPENAGLQSLFWVDQATAFRDFDGIGGGRERLAAAIAAEIGTVAGGERSRRLLAMARERAAAFHTAGRQQETGALRAAAERLRSLEAERQQLEARRAGFDSRVDRLTRLRADRRRLIERDPAGRTRERCETVRRRLAEVEDLERRAELAVEAAKSAAAELARVEAQQRARRDLVDEAERLAAARRAGAGRHEAAARELEVLRQGADAARRLEAGATAAADGAERATAAARGALELARLGGEVERLGSALASCRAARAAAHRAQAVIANNPATAERVAAARDRHHRHQTALARVEAAASRLEFPEAGGGKRARVGDSAVDLSTPLRITQRTELELEGFGRIVVVPGGDGGLQQRREAQHAAEAALAEAMSALGVATLAEAEVALERRCEAEDELRRCRAGLDASLRAFAAESVEALAQLLADREARHAAVRDRPGTPADLVDPVELERRAALRAAEAAQAQEALAAARSALADADRRLAEAAAEAARLQGEGRAADQQLAELRERLALERERLGDEALAAELRAAAERRRGAEERLERVGRELQAGDALGLRERLAIAERELASLDGERRRLDSEVRELEVELRAAGADSWVERLGEVDVALADVRETYRRLELEGRAWRLLAEKLAAADQTVRERLVAPIGTRLQPLLHRVFPGAEAVFDPERLSLTHLRRDGGAEPFDSLSVGAREQLAVLVRLAFASLLAEREGEAPCLILDDALVYADEARFETMKAILQGAAAGGGAQILVLTCRPRDYFGLDARYLRLEDCRGG